MTWGRAYVAGIFLVLILKPFVMGVLFDYHLYICLSQNPAVWHLESLHPGPSAGACTPHFSWVSRLPAAWRYAVWLGWFSAPSRGSLWTCAFSVFPWVFLLLSPKQTMNLATPGQGGDTPRPSTLSQVTQLPRPTGWSWRQKASLHLSKHRPWLSQRITVNFCTKISRVVSMHNFFSRAVHNFKKLIANSNNVVHLYL